MQSLQFIGLDPQDFKEEIIGSLLRALQGHSEAQNPSSQTELLTREEVAELLKASPTTVYRWTKDGPLSSYGIGNRVYYKRHEVIASLILLNP